MARGKIGISRIKRDKALEKHYGIDDLRLYAYTENGDDLTILGEVIADKKPAKGFCFACSFYDQDGDIIESDENDSYGSGLVTNRIAPVSFFSGFPFKFHFYSVDLPNVKTIKLIPIDG